MRDATGKGSSDNERTRDTFWDSLASDGDFRRLSAFRRTRWNPAPGPLASLVPLHQTGLDCTCTAQHGQGDKVLRPPRRLPRRLGEGPQGRVSKGTPVVHFSRTSQSGSDTSDAIPPESALVLTPARWNGPLRSSGRADVASCSSGCVSSTQPREAPTPTPAPRCRQSCVELSSDWLGGGLWGRQTGSKGWYSGR